MNQTTFIYALTEPGTKTIRYFGKADNPQGRHIRHLRDAKNNLWDYYSSRWIRKLQEAGRRPDVHIMCEVPKNDWERFERAFIALGRQHGFRLTNATEGGEAGPSTLGRKKPDGHGKKVSAALLGRKKSESHRQNLSISRTGSKDKDATSKFIGVSFFHPKTKTCNKPWRAMAYVNKVRKQIGNFRTEIEAAQAYDTAAKKFHGAKTKLNFPG